MPEAGAFSQVCFPSQNTGVFPQMAATEDTDEEEEDFVDVPEKEGYEAHIPEHLRQEYGEWHGWSCGRIRESRCCLHPVGLPGLLHCPMTPAEPSPFGEDAEHGPGEYRKGRERE